MEIGGFFEFPGSDEPEAGDSVCTALTSPGGKGDHHPLFLRDGRQAIHAILHAAGIQGSGRVCHLPAYLCASVLQPFLELGIPVKFYPHRPPLEPLLPPQVGNACILLIDTFGAPMVSPGEIEDLLARDNVVILDLSHSLLDASRFSLADPDLFLMASLRKIFPIPDGGIVWCTRNTEGGDLRDPAGYEPMVEAMRLKRKYLEEAGRPDLAPVKEKFLALYRAYGARKDAAPTIPEKIPGISLEILRNISYRRILERRRSNLRFLADGVPGALWLFDPREITSPFFAPILLPTPESRERVKGALIRMGIYPPVHWLLPPEVPPEFRFEHDLSRRVLSIPIDQRYEPAALEPVVSLLRQVEI
jgi:hypothetical protein